MEKLFERYLKTDMRYITQGGFWLVSAQIIGSISGLVTLYFFTSLLPKDVFGSYKYILSFVAVISVFTLPGVNGAVTQAIARGFSGAIRESINLKLKWSVFTVITGGVIGFYYLLNDNYTLAISFFIMAILVPWMNLFYLYRAILSGKSLFKSASLYESITRVCSLMVMVGTAFFTQNLVFLVAVYFLHYTLLRCFFYYWVRRNVILSSNNDPDTISYGKHLSLMNVVGAVASQIDKILVFHYLGASELALYTVAIAPVDQMRGLLGHLESLAFPKFARQTEHDLKKNLPPKIFKFELIIIPCIIAYVFAAPLIFSVLFPDYIDGVLYSQVMAIALIFIPRTLITAALGAKMKTKELYIVRIVGPAVRIGLLFVFVGQFGLWGAIYSVIISELCLYVIYYWAFRKM